jgi:hypothetical protein
MWIVDELAISYLAVASLRLAYVGCDGWISRLRILVRPGPVRRRECGLPARARHTDRLGRRRARNADLTWGNISTDDQPAERVVLYRLLGLSLRAFQRESSTCPGPRVWGGRRVVTLVGGAQCGARRVPPAPRARASSGRQVTFTGLTQHSQVDPAV